ncbi:MAG: SAM-dependent methyltransferase, partial [Methanosarcinales archaeon]
MKVYFVGAGSGDPELITLKGRRLLDEADLVIYTGSLVNPEILTGVKADV